MSRFVIIRKRFETSEDLPLNLIRPFHLDRNFSVTQDEIDLPARFRSPEPDGVVAIGVCGVGTQFQVIDLDGDGLLDVITSNKKGVHYFQQTRK